MKRDNAGKAIWEYIDANAEENMYYILLKKIAVAKKVKMRLNGKQYYKERNLSAIEIKAIKNIIAAYESMK